MSLGTGALKVGRGPGYFQALRMRSHSHAPFAKGATAKRSERGIGMKTNRMVNMATLSSLNRFLILIEWTILTQCQHKNHAMRNYSRQWTLLIVVFFNVTRESEFW